MSRTLFTILALAALVSCESGTALQLVAATVSTSPDMDPPAGIGAWSGGERVGWSPLGEDGAVLLAVPAADAIGIVLTDAYGRPLLPVEVEPGVPLVLRVCRPSSEAIDLGEVRVDPFRCMPPRDCWEEWEAARTCLEDSVDDCVDCPPALCDRLHQILRECIGDREIRCDEVISATAEIRPPPGGTGCEAPR